MTFQILDAYLVSECSAILFRAGQIFGNVQVVVFVQRHFVVAFLDVVFVLLRLFKRYPDAVVKRDDRAELNVDFGEQTFAGVRDPARTNVDEVRLVRIRDQRGPRNAVF